MAERARLGWVIVYVPGVEDAIGFYERQGLVAVEDPAALLRRFWWFPERQMETSVVLAKPRR